MATNEVSANVHDHGKAIDEQKKKAQCNYCGKVVSGFTRLKYHLAGKRGDVSACGEVPANVKELMKEKIHELERRKLRKGAEKMNPPDLSLKRKSSLESKNVKQRKVGTIQSAGSDSGKHAKNDPVSRVNEIVSFSVLSIGSKKASCDKEGEDIPVSQAKKCIGRFLYEMGTDFSAATPTSLRRMINGIHSCHQVEYEFPSHQELKGWILQDEVGVENVVQIVSHSASECMATVGNTLMDKYPTLFWTVSASHCIEMMLEKIGMMDTTREILDKAKTITRFIYSHAMVLNLMRNHTLVHDLVKPSKSKSAIPFLTLQNIVLEKGRLEKMFISSEWKTSCWASRREGKRVADIVLDPSFWSGAEMVLKPTIPLVGVLCSIIRGDKGQMCYIYETMDAVKEDIAEEFENNESQYMPFWELIDEIWNNHLHSALHAAANHLNPAIFYSRDYNFDKEVFEGINCCIEHMVPDEHIQNEIWLQLEQYKDAEGDFGLGKAIERRNIFHPALWWSNYGGHCPELQKLATRILSQTCDGASRYKLKRSLAENLLAKGRIPIGQERLCDLTFVHYNLHLRNADWSTDTDHEFGEIDPMNDWIVWEGPSTSQSNVAPRYDKHD
ncbi:hypothetical protein CK203_096375 [Vitis vinifera]|uniref:BED-type domain-containing protein n=1 Tax=Vitis vinifera TaxID=29760 RepID=A0A438FIF9_VITVI|nr:hypothetical protein CK203_096375 [Vitis vinifera]